MSDTTPVMKRQSGSQKRRRKKVVNITFDDTEFELTREKASASGLSLAAFGRASMLGSPGPRARRSPPLNAELFAYAIAQLNRVGNNHNQLVRRLHAADNVGGVEIMQATQEIRDAVRQICEILGRRDRHDRQRQHTL